MYGGISRLKQHIADVGGEVSNCFSATYEERRIYREILKAAKMKLVDKKGSIMKQGKKQIPEEREVEDPELSLVGSKKPPTLGPLDKIVDKGNLKQTVTNKA